MPEIDPRYASPNLRWSLLLKDHPGAKYDFELWPGEKLDLPAEFGRDRKYCVCIITLPKHPDEVAQREPIIGWKSLTASELEKGDPEVWNVLTTKTLGRALKRAGYPDHLPDLKALLLWYQRKAEIGRIASGLPPLELGTGARMEETLDEAGQHSGDDDDGEGSGVIDGEVVHDSDPPAGAPPPGTARPPAALSDMEARVNRLPAEMAAEVRAKLTQRGGTWANPGRAVEALVVALEERAGRARSGGAATKAPAGRQEAPEPPKPDPAADTAALVNSTLVEGVLTVTGEWPPDLQTKFADLLTEAGIPPLGPWTVAQLSVAEAHLDGLDAEAQKRVAK